MPRFGDLWSAIRGVKPLLPGSVGTDDAEVVLPPNSGRRAREVIDERARMGVRTRDGGEGPAASAR